MPSGKEKEHEKPRLIIDTEIPDWPALDEVRVDTDPRRPKQNRVAERLTILFGGLLTIYIVYAMSVDNQEILSEAFELVKVGLVASIGYAFGKKSSS